VNSVQPLTATLLQVQRGFILGNVHLVASELGESREEVGFGVGAVVIKFTGARRVKREEVSGMAVEADEHKLGGDVPECGEVRGGAGATRGGGGEERGQHRMRVGRGPAGKQAASESGAGGG
jgi:hypothetical protein